MSPLSGELSFATAGAALRAADVSSGTLDLAQVTRADSAGIALLLELTRRAKAAGGTLKITQANPQVRALAAFFGVDSILQLE